MKKILLIALLLLLSCQDKKEYADIHLYGLQIVDSTSIENPSYSYYMSWYNQLKDDTLIRYSSGTDNALELVDLKSKQFIDIYKFKKGSDLGVGRLQGFKYLNRDSIFIFNDTQLVLTNLQNDTIVNVYDVKGDYEGLWYPLSTSNGHDVVIKNNKIYFCKTDFEKTNSNAYYDSPLLMEIDLSSKSTKQYKKIHFPEVYYDKCWQDRLVSYSMYYNSKIKRFVFNFPISHYTYVFNPDNNKIEKYFTPSKYVPEQVERMKCEINDVQKRRAYLFSKSYYYKSIYDPYRDVYYRIVKHGVDKEDAIKLAQGFYGDHAIPFSIMIIDSDFNVIGETSFPENTYTTGDFFVGPKGLYLQSNNMFNSNFDENIIKYDIFLPKQLNK